MIFYSKYLVVLTAKFIRIIIDIIVIFTQNCLRNSLIKFIRNIILWTGKQAQTYTHT